MTNHLINLIADHTGAFVAGTTSVLASVAMLAGQVPIPPGVDPNLVWLALLIGPTAAWLGTRLLSAAGAYFQRLKLHADADAARAQALLDDGDKSNDAPAVLRLEAARARAARMDAFAAAFSAAEKKQAEKP